MRFNKIKFDSEKQKWAFLYEIMRSGGTSDEFSIASKDEPRQALKDCLDGLKKFGIEICELPDDWKSRLTIKGVSFSYAGENDVMGVTITALAELEHSNSPLVLNTPHKIAEFYGETGDEKQLMPEGLAEILDELQEEAEKYVNGERAAPLFEQAEATSAAIGQEGRDKPNKTKKAKIKSILPEGFEPIGKGEGMGSVP